ncbi:MAG: DUF4177 domain-containing protein [Pseudomonadota bacterium]
MGYEYKTVGAPERGKRRRGARTRSDRAAVAVEEILNAQALAGWEYVRTDLVPVEERNGFFGRKQIAHRAVMVFRREKADANARASLTPPMGQSAMAEGVAPAMVPLATAAPGPGDLHQDTGGEAGNFSPMRPEPAPPPHALTTADLTNNHVGLEQHLGEPALNVPASQHEPAGQVVPLVAEPAPVPEEETPPVATPILRPEGPPRP